MKVLHNGIYHLVNVHDHLSPPINPLEHPHPLEQSSIGCGEILNPPNFRKFRDRYIQKSKDFIRLGQNHQPHQILNGVKIDGELLMTLNDLEWILEITTNVTSKKPQRTLFLISPTSAIQWPRVTLKELIRPRLISFVTMPICSKQFKYKK